MRFFATFATLAVAATVSAQSSTASASTSTATGSLTLQQICLNNCPSNNICCQAACVNVPCPSESQVNATTTCAGRCPQGNGTEAETNAYAACQSSCISSYFLSATSAGASATRSAGASGASATGTAASGSHTGTSSHASGTASNTASGSSASATGNSAPQTRVALAGAGLFGLIIAGLAL